MNALPFVGILLMFGSFVGLLKLTEDREEHDQT